jgi:hypothetical protein
MQQFYSQVDVAKGANTSASYLNSCVRNGVIPGPKIQVGLRRYYDQESRDEIVALFEARRREKIDKLVRQQEGEQQ